MTDNILDILRSAIDSRNPDTMPPLTFKGQRRDLPCLRCMRSALAGKSIGECHDSIGGQDRCFECCTDPSRKPHGVSCIPIEETEVVCYPEKYNSGFANGLHSVLEACVKHGNNLNRSLPRVLPRAQYSRPKLRVPVETAHALTSE